MQVDAFTVAAQVLNFLVLVALLKRFLYGPVTRAMADREARIAASLADARRETHRAEAEGERLRRLTDELEQRRGDLLAEARAQAEARRGELLTAAREDAARQRASWREAVEREKEAALEELRRRTVQRVHAIARRALHDLADEELEYAIARSFIRRLEGLDPPEWTGAAEGDDDTPPRAFVVTSAFPLAESVRASIGDWVRRHAGDDAIVRYEVHADAIGGVELRTLGLRVAWSLGDYVDELEGLFPPTGSSTGAAG